MTASIQEPAVLALTGHLTTGTLTARLAPLEAALPDDAAVALIVDASEMTGYDAEARNLFVRRIIALRPRLGRIAIITANPLWHMVVATMRLTTGTEMRAFDTLSAGRRWAERGEASWR